MPKTQPPMDHDALLEAYATWFLTAEKVFAIALYRQGACFAVHRTANGKTEETDEDDVPQGFLNQDNEPLDTRGLSAHARLQVEQLMPAFTDGLHTWMDPIVAFLEAASTDSIVVEAIFDRQENPVRVVPIFSVEHFLEPNTSEDSDSLDELLAGLVTTFQTLHGTQR